MSPRLVSSRRALGAALILAVVLPAGAMGQTTRTYVSQTGASDVNDCTRASPCVTFQRAHDQTIPGGEVNVLETGNYSSLIINRPITIDGNGALATITPFGAGVTINLPSGSGKVALRNLSINAESNVGAYGVDVLRGANVVVDNVVIFGGTQAGIRVQNNQDPATRLIVDDTTIQESAGHGVTISPSGGGRVVRATIRDSEIDENGGAAVRLRPAAGAVARATVRKSHLDANLNGVVADSGDGGTAVANVFRTAITDSGLDPVGPGVAIFSNGANAVVRIARNEIQFNQRGLQATNGGSILSAGDNDIVGNAINGVTTGSFGRQ